MPTLSRSSTNYVSQQRYSRESVFECSAPQVKKPWYAKYFGDNPDFGDISTRVDFWNNILRNVDCLPFGNVRVTQTEGDVRSICFNNTGLFDIHVSYGGVSYVTFYNGAWVMEVAKIREWLPFEIELRPNGHYEIYTKAMHVVVNSNDNWVYDVLSGEIRILGRCHCGTNIRCFVDTRRGDKSLRYYCPICDCAKSKCVRCGQFVAADNTGPMSEARNNLLCSTCKETYRVCSHCSVVYNFKGMGESDNTCCYKCVPIRSYSHKPKAVMYGTGDFRLGVELEVEYVAESSKEVPAEFCDERLDRINRLARMLYVKTDNFVYCKRDGSLCDGPGFEIVSHPATLEYWRKNKDINIIFDLVPYGIRSYETACCGMHVHMSKVAFSSCHLYKMQKLLYEDKEWMYVMSQRKNRPELSKWAKCSLSTDERVRLAKVSKEKSSERYFERRMGLNLQPKDTAELRIFKGTLKKESFMKNLEFVDAAFYYTKQEGMQNVSLKRFGEFVTAQKQQYKYLYDFMSAKDLIKGETK